MQPVLRWTRKVFVCSHAFLRTIGPSTFELNVSSLWVSHQSTLGVPFFPAQFKTKSGSCVRISCRTASSSVMFARESMTVCPCAVSWLKNLLPIQPGPKMRKFMDLPASPHVICTIERCAQARLRTHVAASSQAFLFLSSQPSSADHAQVCR